MMKKLAIGLVLTLFASASCTKKKDPPKDPPIPQLAQADTCSDYVSFGFLESMIADDRYYYRVCDNGVYKDTSSSGPQAHIEYPFSHFVQLDSSKYNRVKNFEQYLPAQLLIDTLASYGSFVVADGRFIRIRIHKGNMVKQYTIDPDTADIPAFLHPIRDTIYLYTQILN